MGTGVYSFFVELRSGLFVQRWKYKLGKYYECGNDVSFFTLGVGILQRKDKYGGWF